MESLDGVFLMKTMILLNLLATIAMGYKQVFGSPRIEVAHQPLEVKQHIRAITEHELQEIKAKQEADRAYFADRLDHLDREFRSELKKDATALHEKINSVAMDVAGLKSATQLQNQYLAQISTKLDSLNSRAS